ncbi:MAG: TatD family nuclease-associated radical SAM protein [Candidatus Thorarchaeota archaeon]
MNEISDGNIIYWRGTSLYINITNRCTNDCIFCVKHFQNGVFGFNLSLTQDPSLDEILQELFRHDISIYEEIVFTGFGEPLLRLDVVISIAKEIKRKSDINLRIDTNGLVELVYPHRDILLDLKNAGIDSLSISLNAESPEKYFEICKPKYGTDSYSAILSFAKKAKEYFQVQFTVVDIPPINISSCKKISEDIGIPLRIRHYSGPELTF